MSNNLEDIDLFQWELEGIPSDATKQKILAIVAPTINWDADDLPVLIRPKPPKGDEKFLVMKALGWNLKQPVIHIWSQKHGLIATFEPNSNTTEKNLGDFYTRYQCPVDHLCVLIID